MDYDRQKVDESVLGLLYLNLHDGGAGTSRAWKGFDWEALDRLHQRGLIANPRNKAKSVLLTADGVEACKVAFDRLFGNERVDP